MTESKTTVMVKGLSLIQTYPASTLSRKYGIAVDLVRKMKLGGQVEIAPTVAMAMEADKLIGRITKKKTKEK